MISLLKGMGKAYSAHRKAKQAEKLANAPKTEEGKLLDKQVKILKKVAIWAPTILGGSAVLCKVKQHNKEKKRHEEYKKNIQEKKKNNG